MFSSTKVIINFLRFQAFAFFDQYFLTSLSFGFLCSRGICSFQNGTTCQLLINYKKVRKQIRKKLYDHIMCEHFNMWTICRKYTPIVFLTKTKLILSYRSFFFSWKAFQVLANHGWMFLDNIFLESTITPF